MTLIVAEFLFRVIGAFILLNIFSLGVWLIMRGLVTRRKLRRMHSAIGKIVRVGRKFHAAVAWNWKGQEVWGTATHLFTLRARDSIPLYLAFDGMEYQLDIWTHNGKGKIAVGVFACLLAIALTFVLV